MQLEDVQELSSLIETAIQSKMGITKKRQRVMDRMQKQKEEQEQQLQLELQKELKRNIFKYASQQTQEDKSEQVQLTSEQIEK